MLQTLEANAQANLAWYEMAFDKGFFALLTLTLLVVGVALFAWFAGMLRIEIQAQRERDLISSRWRDAEKKYRDGL